MRDFYTASAAVGKPLAYLCDQDSYAELYL